MNKRQAMLQIKRVLRDNSFDRYALSKRWSLDFNRLQYYKTSKKLFREQTASGWKHYAFVLMLDVSWSMWSAGDIGSRLNRSRHTLRNIIWLLWDFVHIDVVLFSESFHHLTQTEFMRYKDPYDFDKMIETMRWMVYFDKTTRIANIKTRVYKSHSTSSIDMWDLWWLTNEPPAFQYAYTLLKDFKGKTGIISVCDWDNNCEPLEPVYRWLKHIKNMSSWQRWDRLRYDTAGYNKTPKNFTVQLNWIDVMKYPLKKFKNNVVKVSSKINYVLWIGLATDRPSKIYDNFIRIEQADEVYRYVVKMMTYLMYN